MDMKKRIFTFWEPKDMLPGYITCCLETWRRFLPDCELVILDWQNLGQWLTESEIHDVICRDMTLAMQSDCIRCAVLYRHGGIWMDADTIVTRPLDSCLLQPGCVFVGRVEDDGRRVNYGAFISTDGPGSPFLKGWRDALVPRVAKSARFRRNPLLRVFRRAEWREIRKWDYCVNAIIDPLCNDERTMCDHRFVDSRMIGAMPELGDGSALSGGATPKDLYQSFWFSEGDLRPSDTGGLLLLHNSWTPTEVRVMAREEFLNSGLRMARFVGQLLER